MNKLTPGSNLLWEGSRMMLPEHKDAILRRRQEMNRRSRQEHDEQAIEEMGRIIVESAELGREIRLVVYDQYEHVEIRGGVLRIDPYQQRFLFAHDGLKTWISIRDVEEVE